MFQANELQELLLFLRSISDDILVYTGYKIEELSEQQYKGISVLIDGEYIEKRNNNCVLRGSDNQVIHILDNKFKDKYDIYCRVYSNQIQNFVTKDGIVSAGIHKPGF